MTETPRAAQFARLASLDDRTRRRLYEYVAARHEPASRDEISAGLGIDRSLAAYHLDKLVEHGLLTASFARPEGRRGPGAGRPAKHYQRATTEVAVSLPARDYRLVADLLAKAIEADGDGAVRAAVEHAAGELGRELGGQQPSDLVEVLERQGYEPYHDRGVLRLRNCPFHRVARDHVELICGMNVALMRGLTAALNEEDVDARLDPGPDRCCVAFVRKS